MRAVPHVAGRHIAMPLGGIGTGNVSICADGALRQWQLHNLGNHRGDLPYSFFAVRVAQVEPPLNELRVLQAPPADPGATRTPMVNDDLVPDWQRELLRACPGVTGTTFRASYPVAELDYHDDGLPLEMRLQALTPMIPLDVERSSLPVAMFTFEIANRGPVDVHGWLGVSVQNPVGHDGASAPDGVLAPGYGGNTNRVRREAGWTMLVMDNVHVDPLAAGAGQFVLATDAPTASCLPQWADPRRFLDFLRRLTPGDARRVDPPWAATEVTAAPSPAGATWNGGLAAPFALAPGASATIRVAMAWHFANRYVNFPQFGPADPRWGRTRFWLGNHYTTQAADALAVLGRVRSEWAELEAATQAWVRTLRESALEREAVAHLAAQAVPLRSPTCFRAADGTFFGFEGVLGESTTMWSGDVGGSCPLNCTHVWNYAQAVARLFPALERSMRGTELRIAQAPDGSIPHRIIAPTYLPQLWGREIGGPLEPALDGMLGSLLKCYREVRAGAGVAWLEEVWPHLIRLLAHIRHRWDPEDSGVLRGIQPSTHDIHLRGVNPFMGSLWLAALRATEETARLVADRDLSDECRRLFERGTVAYDELLFNGEYYIQLLEADEPDHHQWGTGCLADQLVGQWWAHLLDLGYVLPREHVHASLRAVLRYNLREGFDDLEHPYRVFATGDETGLVLCTWPRGGRPAVPIRYADEVWAGTEYQVAAHCLLEGLVEEGRRILAGLWGRYDGRRRNPYNQVECGDHYVRSMAGWSVLEALSGQRWDAVSRRLQLRRPPPGGSWPVVLDQGWGELVDAEGQLMVRCHHGVIAVDELRVLEDDAAMDGAACATGTTVLRHPLRLEAGERSQPLEASAPT